jgi:hypothetical protein
LSENQNKNKNKIDIEIDFTPETKEVHRDCSGEQLITCDDDETKTVNGFESGLPDLSWPTIPKRGKCIPNCHKINQKAIIYFQWP